MQSQPFQSYFHCRPLCKYTLENVKREQEAKVLLVVVELKI